MLLLIILLIFETSPSIISAAETKTYYARILFDQVYLYKTAVEDDNVSNIYFELPKTYFVELIASEGEFYQARYMNMNGYVKKDSVQAVNTIPKTPFLNVISFRVYADLSRDIRSTPTQTDQNNLVIQVPSLTKNLQYYGKVYGECLIENRTDVWYYCKYTADKDYYGYVYSDFCDEMQNPLPENTEELNYITNPTFEIATEPSNTIPITSNSLGIIIAILSIPALIFMFILMKGTKLISKDHQKNKEIIDY